ncbi:cytochrome c/ABC transporter substrate-binding protein [Sorangium sp. So ce1099]|uniref:cytochrome c/ABC transporter substrate-binding protein n=1 Tax=Sorangium sp. So ce1099 TaxID=3133331 RepID=UPI003F607330
MTKTRGARAHGALAAGLGSALVLAAALKGAASLGDARAPAPVAPAACAGAAPCAGPTACAELSPAALRGRRIFHHGALASGEPVEGRLGEGGAALRGKAAACAGCHGRSGDGAAEGGVAAPPLTPEQLFSTDRPGGPYTAEALAAAVREGRTPSARELHLVMPRYRLDDAHLADLVAYLRCVGRDADPGVSPDALRLGAALPLTGRFAAAGAAARDVLAASFAEVNAQGGVFRRRLELVVADSGESLDGARATSRLLDQRVFALVGTVWSGDGGGDAPARLAADEVPLVGPLGSGPPAADPGDGVVFHLQPGLDTLARVAVAHLAGAPAPAGAEALLVIHPADPRGDGFLRGARAEALRRGLPAPVSLPFEPGRFDAAAASAAAARLRPRAVLLAGEGDELSRWLAAPRPAAGARGPRPAVYAPASLMPQDPGSLRLAGAARLLLLHPGPFDEAERLSLLSLSSFLERHRIPSRHTAFQARAYAAASVLVEALKRAGAHLTRPGLVAALEGLRAFDPGPGPAITFGRNRRVGAYGAGLSRVDPSSASVAHLAPVSAWVEVVP